MSFLDERDDPPRSARARRPPPRGPSTDPQTLLTRRIVAAGGALLVVILLFLGVKGCLASQKEQSFKDYVREAAELTAESEQQSQALFELLRNPGSSDPAFGSNVNGSKVQAEQLLDRAKNTDHPDQLDSAHRYLVETLEFRRDGLGGIAKEVDVALGKEGAREATERIANQMLNFLTSDVIYSQRFLPKLLGALEQEDLSGDVPVPDSLRNPKTIAFLPDIDWLRASTVRDRLARIGGGGDGAEAAAPGLHGTGLGAVTVKPGGAALTEGRAADVKVAESLSLDVQIQNQGENPEENIVVAVEIAGGGEPIQLEETLDAINAGETKTVSIPLAETPPIGQPVTISISIEPVPGEKKTDNNKGSFKAIFTR